LQFDLMVAVTNLWLNAERQHIASGGCGQH
jgi:hypothetical protein